MNTRQLFRREPWMTTTEWRHALRYRRALLADLDSRGVYVHPAMAMRLHNYLLMLVLTLRVESAWLMPASEDAPPPVPTPAILQELAESRLRLARLLAEIEHGPQADAGAPPLNSTPASTPAPGRMADPAVSATETVTPSEPAAPEAEQAPVAPAPAAAQPASAPGATPAVNPAAPAVDTPPVKSHFPAQRPIPPRSPQMIYIPRKQHDRPAPNGTAR